VSSAYETVEQWRCVRILVKL